MTYRHLFIFSLLLLLISCEKEEPVVVTPTPPVVTPPTTPDPDPDPVEPTERADVRIGFYNVENLFDTVDDANNPKDDEFLPSAAKQWTQERYEAKLNNIGLVMQGIEFPELMGFSEVENEAVLVDLANSELLKDQGYDIVHIEGPDYRGIDNGLLYKKDAFTVLETEAIEVRLPASVSEFSTTRDILMVKGNLGAEIVYIFVNHWPSRSGGLAATTGKREFAASVLRDAIDTILEDDATANIIALGDFNDEPSNASMVNSLEVKNDKTDLTTNDLFNCTVTTLAGGQGSYFFDGNWQMLDQIIVSGQLLDDNGTMKAANYFVYDDESVMFNHPTDGLRPDRTYGGDEYFGGYSDHLAVFLELTKL
ncbi:MAG: endonuclease [Saprospiraceae bacterium]